MQPLAHTVRSLLFALSKQPRWIKNLILTVLDCCLLAMCLFLAFAVRFSPNELSRNFKHFHGVPGGGLAVTSIALWFAGLYRPVLRHAGQELLGQVLRGVLFGSICFAIVLFFQPKILLPRSIVVMGPIFGLLSLISMRLIFRWIIRVHLLGSTNQVRSSVAIYGAGAAGLELYESLLHQRTYLVRVFVDDDPKLQGRQLRGIPIVSPSSLEGSRESLDLQWVFLAIPKVSHQRRKEILENCGPCKLG